MNFTPPFWKLQRCPIDFSSFPGAITIIHQALSSLTFNNSRIFPPLPDKELGKVTLILQTSISKLRRMFLEGSVKKKGLQSNSSLKHWDRQRVQTQISSLFPRDFKNSPVPCKFLGREGHIQQLTLFCRKCVDSGPPQNTVCKMLTWATSGSPCIKT